MKGVGSMRRLLSFIFAILIVVFAVMPNVYAEAQNDYGNLDMNRWVLIGTTTSMDKDLLIDKTSLDYTSSTDKDLLCNLWICYFNNADRNYSMQNVTVNYFDKSYTIDTIVIYDKNGNIEFNYTDPVPQKEKVVPSSMGEILYYVAFPPELMESIRKEAMKD